MLAPQPRDLPRGPGPPPHVPSLRERVAFGSDSPRCQLEGPCVRPAREVDGMTEAEPSLIVLALRVVRGELSEEQFLEIVREKTQKPQTR